MRAFPGAGVMSKSVAAGDPAGATKGRWPFGFGPKGLNYSHSVAHDDEVSNGSFSVGGGKAETGDLTQRRRDAKAETSNFKLQTSENIQVSKFKLQAHARVGQGKRGDELGRWQRLCPQNKQVQGRSPPSQMAFGRKTVSNIGKHRARWGVYPIV